MLLEQSISSGVLVIEQRREARTPELLHGYLTNKLAVVWPRDKNITYSERFIGSEAIGRELSKLARLPSSRRSVVMTLYKKGDARGRDSGDVIVY